MNVLGIDIGGTKIFVGRYSTTLQLEAETTVPTLAQEPKEKTLANLLQAINQLRDEKTAGLGIAWAGFVDTSAGRVIKAPNLPSLNEFNLGQYLTACTELPVYLENDARAFAYGAKTKVVPESAMCVGLIIGTGVGSGIICEDQLVGGAHNYAGEIGHINLQGQEVETWLAGPGLKQHLNVAPELNFSELLPAKKSEVLAKISQPLAVFGQWLSNIVLFLDPDHIIVGGGTATYFWQHFETEILEHTKQALTQYPNQFKLSFYDSSNAGAEGAAQLMIKQLKNHA